MGGALLKAWVGSSLVRKEEVFAAEHKAELLKIYKKQGIACDKDVSCLKDSAKAKLIVFAVKPNVLKEAASQATFLADKNTVILSIVAGKTVKFIESAFPFKLPVVRIMPNMGVSEGLGVSGMFANSSANKKQKDFCFKLMSQTGLAFWVKKEDDLHIITAVGGSSPAYVYASALALQRASEKYGIQKELAQKIAANVLLGSAFIFANGGGTLEEAVARIATAGGTTEAAIKIFDADDALLKLYKKAMDACIKRSKELGK